MYVSPGIAGIVFGLLRNQQRDSGRSSPRRTNIAEKHASPERGTNPAGSLLYCIALRDFRMALEAKWRNLVPSERKKLLDPGRVSYGRQMVPATAKIP
jgi:hypothetical protein